MYFDHVLLTQYIVSDLALISSMTVRARVRINVLWPCTSQVSKHTGDKPIGGHDLPPWLEKG